MHLSPQGGIVGGATLSASVAEAQRIDNGWYTVPSPSVPKTILITGANSGIGFAAAGKLAAAGHNVHLICRTMAKAEKACEQIEVCSIIFQPVSITSK
jgi:NADP-dependent 3-hydroxy acid dehydrogenase YdfG